MKKFFTLVAVAAMAMTANAKLVLTEINIGCTGTVGAWDWMQQATNDSESHQDETTGDWILDKEATYDYKDASAYDYIVVQFEQNEVGGHFICVDNTWEKKISTDFIAKADYVAVDLATSEVGTFKDNITCFVMQPFAAGNLKIKEIAYMSKAEYEEMVASYANVEKTEDLATYEKTMEPDEQSAGWNCPGWIGKTSLSDLYKTLVFEVTCEHEFKLVVQDWDGTNGNMTNYLVSAASEPVKVCIPISATGFNGLGQYAVQNLYVTDYQEPSADPKTGEMIDNSEYGQNTVKVTKCYLTSKVEESTYTPWTDPHDTAIKAVAADSAAQNTAKMVKDGKIVIVKNGVEYNVAGQQVK